MQRHIKSAGSVLVLAAVLAMGVSWSRAEAPATQPTSQAVSTIVEAVAPALVHVEYTLQFDKGEAPQAGGWATRCPNCGQYHGGGDGQEAVNQERPIEAGGVLIGPKAVITGDLMVHPRFVKRIVVRFGDQVVDATPSSYATGQNALLLELAEPLAGARPVVFDAAGKGPYYTVNYAQANGEWAISVKPLGGLMTITDQKRRYLAVPSNSLIVDKSGGAVGMCMSEELPPDESWKGSPVQWPMLSAESMKRLQETLQQQVNAGLLRVTLDFRSPAGQGGSARRYMSRDEEQATERRAIGVLVDERTLLILAELKPKATARLERIRVTLDDGREVAARFAHSLLDYGALVATLETPLPNPIKLRATDDLRPLRNILLPCAEVQISGDQRVTHLAHRRIAGFEVGWRRNLYVQMPGDNQHCFLFDPEGALAVLPVVRREKAAEQERWSSEGTVKLTGVGQLRPVLENPGQYADAANVPLSEEEENRLAWLGVELQALNAELARANNVSDQTKEGETGGLVTYVYPNSPAAAAGIEPGYILLRLHVADQPKPIDVDLEEYGDGLGGQPFPWDQLDRVPEQYFDQIPHPWPSASSSINQTLTDLGFGKKFVAEFFHAGKVVRKEMQVTASPAHYESAGRFKSESLGLTVRDLTYEVRRYFQKTEMEPGVIVSKIETGSKASVGGIRPFEIITHVNDQPVLSAKDFQKLTDGQSELRLSVKRMTRGRLVRLQVSAPATTQSAATTQEK